MFLHSTKNSKAALSLNSHSKFTFARISAKMQEKKMVLIIDDSVSIVQRLVEMLKEEKQVGAVEYATSIADAKAFLMHTIPDVVLLDIHLSDGNGVDVLRYLKKDHPGVRVIMLTNEVNDYYKDLCKRLGAYHFADKSKDFNTLSGVINSLN